MAQMTSPFRVKRLLLCVATFFFWFSLYVYNPFMTPFLLGLGLTASLVGTIVGAYGFTQMLVRFPLGLSADRLKKHRVFIIAGMALSLVACVLRLLLPSAVPMLLANILSGVAASTWISFTILYACYYEKEETSKAIGTLTAMNNAGTLTGYLLGGVLFEAIGMPALFLAGAIAALIGLGVALFVHDEPSDNGALLSFKELLQVIKDKRLWIFAFGALLYHLILFATANSFSSTLIKEIGGSGTDISIASALFMGASMLAAWSVGTKPMQRIGEKNLIPACFLLLGIYAFAVPHVTNIPLFMGFQVIGGLGGSSLISLLMANAVKEVPYSKRSSAMGLFQSFYAVGIMVGPVITGAIRDVSSYAVAYTLIGILAVTSAIFIVFSTKAYFPKTNKKG